MTPREGLALAALVHDLPALFAGMSVPDGAARVLALATALPEGGRALLATAERYATLGGAVAPLDGAGALQSIFGAVQRGSGPAPAPLFHQRVPLAATPVDQSSLFPSPSPDDTPSLPHLRRFLSQLDRFGQQADLTAFEVTASHLVALLHRFGWCLPAHSPTISLLDHSVLTSAIAACLAAVAEERGAAAIPEEAACFCLVVGDLSGIQDYIFDIATIGAGGVARRLRARSFTVSVLADVIGHQMAHFFEVPLGNLIMSSGGKFYLLLPALADVGARLRGFRREMDRWFHERFNGEIAMNLAHICFAGGRFRASQRGVPGFGVLVAELAQRLAQEKQRRAHHFLTTEDGAWHTDAFVIREGRDFEGAAACLSCRKFPGRRADGLCGHCARDRAIGRQLLHTSYLAFYRERVEPGIEMPGGYTVQLLGDPTKLGESRPYLVVRLNNPDLSGLEDLPGGFRYLANHVPLQSDGTQMAFDQIAQQSTGRPLLGYLKADVDYLGILFAAGLQHDSGSFDTAAHVMALSRQLDLFFSGWVQHLLSQEQAFGFFYTIFSGGDDLFLVGPWSRALPLAQRIHREFTRFVGMNPDITLSAGILLTKEHYPIARAADDAEAVLERAKEEAAPGRTTARDQIALLGDTLAWSSLTHVSGEIEMLMTNRDRVNSALLNALVRYGNLYKQAQAGDIESYRYKPLFAYQIARNLRPNKDVSLYQWADTLLQSLHGGGGNETMRHLGLIATYALYLRRERRGE